MSFTLLLGMNLSQQLAEEEEATFLTSPESASFEGEVNEVVEKVFVGVPCCCCRRWLMRAQRG